MTPDREREAARICDAALDRTALEREAFVVEECAGDEALRREVESLLRQLSKADEFLQRPALDVAAERMPPALVVGQQVGPYLIEGLLGAGGMGEVYRARDAKLGRDVAIKVLPRIFTSDPERVARFDREARLLAALNHPNIGALYGHENIDGASALILELVEGSTLASRLTKGPFPVPDALRVAGQIAGALEAAHERGIVHRDLKPANVTITPSGAVKVLDFGLARAVAGDASDPDSSHSPEEKTGGTKDGVILGTIAYMSPEQARGRPVDKRADIWAFGCVFYEMLTGRPAFPGDTLSDTVASVLTGEPDWRALPETTPASIQHLLRRCLERDASRRLRDIGDARLDIDEALTTPAQAHIDRFQTTTRTWPGRMAWTLAGAGVVALAGALALPYLRAPRVAEEGAVRFTLAPPADAVLPPNQSFALSPDGRRLTFAAVRAGTRQLWVRPLDSLEAHPLPGTEDARDPIWSPDGGTVAFLADGKLKAVDVGGGAPRTLCDMPLTGPPLYGGSWSPDGGTIVFGQRQAGVFSVAATGGAPTALPGRAEPGETRQFQTFLPDGKRFIYLSEPSNNVWLGSLDATEPPVQLMSAAFNIEYVAPGYLLFLRHGRLMAQRFDTRRASLADEPVLIAEGVASFRASLSGALVYLADPLDVTTQLTWADRTGHRLGVTGPPGRYRNPEISPDGTGAVMEVVGSRSPAPDVVYLEFKRGIITRLTSDPANDDFPVWAPDGHEIIFSSDRTGVSQLYRIRVDGTGEERVLQSPTAMNPNDWTPDGLLVFRSMPSYKLGVLPLTAGGVPRDFDPSQRLSSGSGQVSPNGHWIAYDSPRLNPETSDRRRLFNVFVQGFPVPGAGKVQVSANGGVSPRWSRDGRELFFYAGDGRLTAVPVTSDGGALKVGTASALFDPSLLNGVLPRIPLRQQYDVTRDGRFLLNVPVEHVSDQSFTVLVNWAGGLTR